MGSERLEEINRLTGNLDDDDFLDLPVSKFDSGERLGTDIGQTIPAQALLDLPPAMTLTRESTRDTPHQNGSSAGQEKFEFLA